MGQSDTDEQTTRERLLEAAGRVFGERGFPRATIRAICREADANVAAVNYHFGDKSHLYEETLEYAFERLHETHPTPRPTDSERPVVEVLREFVNAFLSRMLAIGSSWHGQLIARELATPSAALETVVVRFMRPTLESLDAVLLRARPDLSEDERRLHILSLIGQCVFFRHARPVLDILFGPTAYQEEEIPRLTDHIVTIFMKGLDLRHDG